MQTMICEGWMKVMCTCWGFYFILKPSVPPCGQTDVQQQRHCSPQQYCIYKRASTTLERINWLQLTSEVFQLFFLFFLNLHRTKLKQVHWCSVYEASSTSKRQLQVRSYFLFLLKSNSRSSSTSCCCFTFFHFTVQALIKLHRNIMKLCRK